MTETLTRTHLTNEGCTEPAVLQPIEGFICPAWCVETHDQADVLKSEAAMHQGAPITWMTARGSEWSARLVWFEILGPSTPDAICYGAFIEIEGDDGSGSVGISEFDVRDAATMAQVFAELSAAAGLSFEVAA